MPSRRRHSRGMSTMELLAATALSLMILGVAISFFTAQQRALMVQNTYAESQNVTRTFTDLISRELRMASYDPLGPNAAIPVLNNLAWCPGAGHGLISATRTSIRFQQDLNADGDTGDAGEDVTYRVNGNTIERQDGAAAPVTLVTGVPDANLTFRYFDGSNPPVEYNPAGSPAQLSAGQLDCVAKVQITVTASLPSPDPYRTTPIQSQVQTEVALRNRSLMNF